MFSRKNRLLVAGVITMLAGGCMFFCSNTLLPVWVTFLIGPFVWYLGGAMVFAGVISRLLSSQPETQALAVSAAAAGPMTAAARTQATAFRKLLGIAGVAVMALLPLITA